MENNYIPEYLIQGRADTIRISPLTKEDFEAMRDHPHETLLPKFGDYKHIYLKEPATDTWLLLDQAREKWVQSLPD